MLTPVDIQEKTFHTGIGYDKKDVNSFIDEVFKSYSELYRSNAELTEQVNTLTDGLQNYKSKEAALEKSLMLAEKDSEDTKAKALKEAKTIELDAKNRANNIVADAEKRLTKITKEIEKLETQYAAYKSNFCSLMKMQYAFLKENDFDMDAYIDEKALTLLGGSAGGGSYRSQASASDTFTGDPQMRDESTLSGTAKATYNEYGEDTRTSTSAVYTSNLGSNENFVDPFNTEAENGRYNPYDGRTAKSSSASTSFKVSSGKGKNRTAPNKPKAASGTKSADDSSATAFKTADPEAKINKQRQKPPVKEDAPKQAPSPEPEEPKEEPVTNPEPEYKAQEPEYKAPETEEESSSEQAEEETGAIPTIEPDVEDIEDAASANTSEQALLPDGDEPSEDADDDGFEFV